MNGKSVTGRVAAGEPWPRVGWDERSESHQSRIGEVDKWWDSLALIPPYGWVERARTGRTR